MSAASGKKEGHYLRLFLFAIFSLFCAVFAQSSIYSAYSVLVTSITILTGFTFTALFSDHTMADTGLPPAKNETDRTELIRLGVLGENFKFRSSYFIALSIIGAVLMTVSSLDLYSPKFLSELFRELWPNVVNSLQFDPKLLLCIVLIAVPGLITFIVVFIYLECLYTFYRLSETIISIINRRREYIKHSETGV